MKKTIFVFSVLFMMFGFFACSNPSDALFYSLEDDTYIEDDSLENDDESEDDSEKESEDKSEDDSENSDDSIDEPSDDDLSTSDDEEEIIPTFKVVNDSELDIDFNDCKNIDDVKKSITSYINNLDNLKCSYEKNTENHTFVEFSISSNSPIIKFKIKSNDLKFIKRVMIKEKTNVSFENDMIEYDTEILDIKDAGNNDGVYIYLMYLNYEHHNISVSESYNSETLETIIYVK